MQKDANTQLTLSLHKFKPYINFPLPNTQTMFKNIYLLLSLSANVGLTAEAH